jgi:hypothetical protein
MIAVWPAAAAVNAGTDAQTRNRQGDNVSIDSPPYRNAEVRFSNERGHVELAGTMSVPSHGKIDGLFSAAFNYGPSAASKGHSCVGQILHSEET